MRIAALAFGVLAGLVASLILALGGLDAGVALATAGDRQVSLIRFGLFVIANLGVFGAALVLAVPLAGAILLVLGALSWIVAALLLHHTTDLVLIVPPALLLIATAFAVVAYLRRDRRVDDDTERDAALSRDFRAPPEPEDFEELPPVPVGAGFFGQGGTAQPLGTEHPPARAEVRSPRGDDWEPVRRPKPPPRQKSMFRQPDDDDDDDEEASGLSRFAFGFSGILSFGLYAALAGAAVLVFLNLRTGDHPGAAKIVPSVSSPAVATLPPSSEATQAPVLTAAVEPSSSLPPPSSSPLSDDASRLQEQSGLTFQSSQLPPPEASSEPDSASAGPDAASSAEPTTDSSAVMPFTMSPQMAAERAQPAPAPTRSSPATPTPDAGL